LSSDNAGGNMWYTHLWKLFIYQQAEYRLGFLWNRNCIDDISHEWVLQPRLSVGLSWSFWTSKVKCINNWSLILLNHSLCCQLHSRGNCILTLTYWRHAAKSHICSKLSEQNFYIFRLTLSKSALADIPYKDRCIVITHKVPNLVLQQLYSRTLPSFHIFKTPLVNPT